MGRWIDPSSLVVLVLACAGDGATHSATNPHGIDTSASSSGSGPRTPAESTSTTSSTVGDGEEASSGSGGDDMCPPLSGLELNAGVGVNAKDWPDYGPVSAICTLVDIAPSQHSCCDELQFECEHTPEAMRIPIRVSLYSDIVSNRLDPFIGSSDLRLQFYHPEDQINGGPYYGIVSLREASGALVFLTALHLDYASQLGAGETVDIGRAGWLAPGSPEYADWCQPFSEISLVNVGCASQGSIRAGSLSETPLAVELSQDDGVVTVHDRSIEPGLVVDDVAFDAIVSDAFYRHELTCGDCPFTEGRVILIRAAQG